MRSVECCASWHWLIKKTCRNELRLETPFVQILSGHVFSEQKVADRRDEWSLNNIAHAGIEKEPMPLFRIRDSPQPGDVFQSGRGFIDGLPIQHGGSFHGKLLVITRW